MNEQVQRTSCSDPNQHLLAARTESTLCNDTQTVENDPFYELANKLRHEIQIPHKYFVIESLLLYNVSLSEEPTRYQEYAVYKRCVDGSHIKVESVTVNGNSTTVSKLAGLLKNINKRPLTKFTDQIRIYDDKLTANEFEAFKQRFAAFEASY